LWKYERREERRGGKKEGSRKESGEDECRKADRNEGI